MKFFTPELYLRFNSPDDQVADRANEDWESAIRAYRSHLDRLADQMPAQVKKLANLDLHDAEFLADEETSEPLLSLPFEPFPLWFGFILAVKQGDEIVYLTFVLWDRIRRHEPEASWPFSKQRTHWLYDEIDADTDHPGRFLHRVLLSDGVVIEIPFVSALVHRMPVQVNRRGRKKMSNRP